MKKENTEIMILKQKRTSMVEDGEDWNGLEMTILKSLAIFFFFFQNIGTMTLLL